MAVLKAYCIALLSCITLTCQATNTSSEWNNVSHSSATSDTHGKMGDYIPIGSGISPYETSSALESVLYTTEHLKDGLGVSVEETSSTPATTICDSSVRRSSINFLTRRNNESDIRANTTSTANASGDAQVIMDTANGSSFTDCSQSWLNYWSMSSINKPTRIVTISYLTTSTGRSHDLIFTTLGAGTGTTYTETYAYSSFSTLRSDNFAVSVTVSEVLFTWTVTDVDHTVSLISKIIETYTKTTSNYYITTMYRSSTSLPTPRCQLPAFDSACSDQWGTYISGSSSYRHYEYGSFPGTPDCTQVVIEGDWCTSMASFYFARETAYGQTENVGWLTANSTTYFPASKSLAPGCTLGCQACSITGNSVQLYYWPPSTATLLENGTETATLTPLIQDGSAKRTVLVDGTTLTSPTVYISYDILHAADSCGAVGNTYRNTILPLSNTNHLFSMQPAFRSKGARQEGWNTFSFNLADLIEPIPDDIYNKQKRCQLSSVSSYPWGLGHGGSNFTCARTEPYAPIIGVPPEARELDPMWSSCEAWYGGLFDPPKALQPADAIAKPTLSATTTPPAATPQPTVDSGLPTKTPAPVTPLGKPETIQSNDGADPPPPTRPKEPENDSDHIETGKDGAATSAVDKAPQSSAPNRGSNAPSDPSDGVASFIMSIFLPKASQTSEAVEDPAAPSADPVLQLEQPKVVQSLLTMADEQHMAGQKSDSATESSSQSRTLQGSVGSEVAQDAPMVTPTPDSGPSVDHRVVIGKGPEAHTALSSQGLIFLDGPPLVDGQATVVFGQTISVKSGIVHVNGAQQQTPALERPPALHRVFTAADQEHTAVQNNDDAVRIDGGSYTFGAITAVDGSKIPVTSEGIIVGATTIPYEQRPAQHKQGTVFTINEHTYSVDWQSRSLLLNSVPIPDGSTITTNGDVLTIGFNAIAIQGTTIAIPNVEPALAGANVVLADESITASGHGADVLIAGATLTVGQVTTISGTEISVASDSIVVGVSKTMFPELESTAAKIGVAVTIGGTAYAASTMAGQFDVVLLAGQKLVLGSAAATIHGQVVTNGTNGVSTVDPIASATSTAESNNAQTVFKTNGTAYTVTLVWGHSGAVAPQDHTLSVGGSAVTIADNLITKGSDGRSVADATSLPSVTSSELRLSTDVPESPNAQDSPLSSPEGESRASKAPNGFGGKLTGLAILFSICMNL